jgi:hypothetical protein
MVDQNLSAPLSEAAAEEFGRAWAGHWNSGDIEAVLAHFAEDCVFESPLAEKHAGTTRLRGKPALRAYWREALSAIGTVHFTVQFVAVSTAQRAIAIVYCARLGERYLHACERLIFNPSGQVVAGMGLYGPKVLSEV